MAEAMARPVASCSACDAACSEFRWEPGRGVTARTLHAQAHMR